MPDLYDALRERGCIDPALFRAMVRSHIGEGCPFPTIKAAAGSYGVHPEQLRLFIRGKRPAEPKLLAAFGLEKVTIYALAQGMSAREGENSRSEVEGEARQPGPKDAPND